MIQNQNNVYKNPPRLYMYNVHVDLIVKFWGHCTISLYTFPIRILYSNLSPIVQDEIFHKIKPFPYHREIFHKIKPFPYHREIRLFFQCIFVGEGFYFVFKGFRWKQNSLAAARSILVTISWLYFSQNWFLKVGVDAKIKV